MATKDPFAGKPSSGTTGAVGAVIRPLGGSGATTYLGGMANVGQHAEYDTTPSGGRIAVSTPGYVNGDQTKLLPTNAQDLATLQQALVQAGYITQAQANQMVLGSPDQITSGAFAKLLATANMSGSDWRNALASRLATAGQTAPDNSVKTPPLTIQVTNPDDLKATLQKTAQTLLGGNMSDDQANLFVKNFQDQETAAQTQAYNQQYTPGVGYGPGGTTTKSPDMGAAAEDYAKAADPTQYKATAFGSAVGDALNSLRTSGYLS